MQTNIFMKIIKRQKYIVTIKYCNKSTAPPIFANL